MFLEKKTKSQISVNRNRLIACISHIIAYTKILAFACQNDHDGLTQAYRAEQH